MDSLVRSIPRLPENGGESHFCRGSYRYTHKATYFPRGPIRTKHIPQHTSVCTPPAYIQSGARVHPDVFPAYIIPSYIKHIWCSLGQPNLFKGVKACGLLSYINKSLHWQCLSLGKGLTGKRNFCCLTLLGIVIKT